MKTALKVARSATALVLGFAFSLSAPAAARGQDQSQSQVQNQDQGQNQIPSQNQTQSQNQNQTQSQSQTQPQSQNQTQPQSQSQTQPQSQTQNQNLKPKNDVNEIGNRKVAHMSMISTEKEIAMGKQYATQIDHSAKIITDPVVNEYINRIAQNVARNSDLTIPLTVKVLDSPEINAFALPGGFLYVNSGLIMAADEEDQVAGVMAHEIAHVAARHWASQMTKMTLLQYAMIPMIFVPMSYPIYLGVSQALNFGIPVAFMKFNRNSEAEADYLGLQYMYKAGYDPSSYPAFFGKIMEEERRSPGSVSSVFADHPPTPDRIIKCEEEIQKILPQKNEYLVSTSEFSDVKGRLQTVLTTRKKGAKAGPTLEKRQTADNTTNTTQTQTQSGSGSGSDQSGDQPPVLRRRDQSQ